MKYTRETSFREKLADKLNKYKRIGAVLLVIFAIPITVFLSQKQTNIQEHAAGVQMLHVVGNQIIDANGNPVLFRGAQVEGIFNGNNQQVIQHYPTTVTIMARDWHMNAIRVPTCNWFWQADPTGYISRLQTAVQQANQAGLYFILDLHDDHNCNPPYPWPGPYHLPRSGMDTYWQAVATTFKSNPMVIFDVYNEPNIQARPKEGYTNADWQLWLNGGTVQDSNGSETFIGMQHLVDVIRQTGAQQILMVEGYTTAETFHNIGNNTVTDPLHNIVYEAHKYGVADGAVQWDTDFGFMSTTYPVFVGEWALMGGGNSGQINCGGIVSPQQADQTVTTFLAYLASHNIGWTAYSFNPEHMIYTDTNGNFYSPTTFYSGWVCPGRGNNVINHAGMGADVLKYLIQSNQPPSITPTPTFTPTPTPSLCTTSSVGCGECSAPNNTCGVNNGTQSCVYDGPQPCQSQTVIQNCTIDSCGLNICVGDVCMIPTPTLVPTSPPTPTPVSQESTVASDSFSRANQTYWGNGAIGGQWFGDANTQKNFSISNNTGEITDAVGGYNGLLGPQLGNSEVLFTAMLNKVNNFNFGAVLHFTDRSNRYFAYINERNTLTIQKKYQGLVKILGSVNFTIAANSFYTFRFRVQGNNLLAKVWQDKTQEPVGWMLALSDSSPLPAGFGGIRIFSNGTTATFTSFVLTKL